MLPLAILTVAGILIYAGIHGYSVADTVGIALGRTPHRQATNPSVGATSLASSEYTGGGESGSVAIGGGISQFDGHPVASWIVPILQWARAHGWRGVVTSGYRTPSEQLRAAEGYGLEHYGAGGPLGSNHVGYIWPEGAVDVTHPEELATVLRGYPGSPKLVWGGPTIGDRVHFSSNGH